MPARAPKVNLRVATGSESHESHPTMGRALAELEHARAMLQNEASHDFHGHRKAAIHQIDGAIHELREGIRSDRD